MSGSVSASSCSVRRSRRPQTRQRHAREPGDLRRHLRPNQAAGGEGKSHTARVYACEESHSGVVPMNHSNKDKRSSAESGEGRPLINENASQPNTRPTRSGEHVSQGLARVRKAAPETRLRGKPHREWTGVTWQEYETGLENRLTDLHGRVHRGAYRALPSRRPRTLQA